MVTARCRWPSGERGSIWTSYVWSSNPRTSAGKFAVNSLLCMRQLVHGHSAGSFNLVELVDDDRYARLLQTQAQPKDSIAPRWVQCFLLCVLNGSGQDDLGVAQRFQLLSERACSGCSGHLYCSSVVCLFGAWHDYGRAPVRRASA